MESVIKISLISLIILICSFALKGQDPFFMESRQIKSYINPALAGLSGSYTTQLIMKNQYLNDSDDFLSAGISIEGSAPCLNADFGLYYIADREGDGLLTSQYIASNYVYTLKFGKNNVHNIRTGLRLQWIHKSIDWGNLIFSDQLDPKYGLYNASKQLNVSAFSPPDWNSNSWYTMGLGFIHRFSFEIPSKDKMASLTYGFGLENFSNAFEDKTYDSLLRIPGSSNGIDKITVYVESQLPLSKKKNNHFGIIPSYVLQRQSKLISQQFGFEITKRRQVGVGFFFNMSDLRDFEGDTKSLITEFHFLVPFNVNGQLEVNIYYMHNIGGLADPFGPSIQMGFRYSFRKNMCGGSPGRSKDCFDFSNERDILYENIWFPEDKDK